jgi:predicted transcriptional regulator
VKLYKEVWETIDGKHMKTPLKLLLMIGMLGLFVFLTFVDIFSTEAQYHEGLYGTVESHHALIMGVLGILGIVIGAVLYALLDAKIERATEEIKVSSELLLRFLDPQQKKIIQHLIEHNGQANQRELTYIEGFDKLKVHRTLKTLETKGVITIAKHGKINKVRLPTEVQQLFSQIKA